MKRCLVTGATGFIGSNLVKRLVEEGYDVYALIRPNSCSGIERLKDAKEVKYIVSNPKDIFNKYELPQLDVCFNLAAYGVNYDNQDVYEMIDGNIKYLMEVIDFVSKNNTKLLVHTGSCFEYGLGKEGISISEDSRLKPQSLYSASKTAATVLGNIYAKNKNVNMITLRPFGVYGPGEAEYRFIPQLIKAALNNEELYMTEGEQIRDYLYIDDLVDVYIKISNSPKIERYGIYNVCSGKAIKIKEFIDIICELTQCNKGNFKLGKLDYRKDEVMYFVGNNKKIMNLLEWKPKFLLKQGLKTNIEWYKNIMNRDN